jgi:tRNA modification GTPase
MAVLLNMTDEARKRGIAVDAKALSARLGVPVHPISARTGEGLEALEDKVREWFSRSDEGRGELLTNARQAESVLRAVECLEGARCALSDGMYPDAVLSDVEAALAALGELNGLQVSEDVTSRIFERFCVGK